MKIKYNKDLDTLFLIPTIDEDSDVLMQIMDDDDAVVFQMNVDGSIESSQGLRLDNDVKIMSGAGVPVDGTTGDNFAGPGSIYINISAGNAYLQTGLITSPVWKLVTRAA